MPARTSQRPPSLVAWLLDQFERYQPVPAAWSGQQRTDLLLGDYQTQQRAVRDASDADKQAARQTLRRSARDDGLSAVNARLTSALDTPAPFVERLVHFCANHFAISVEKPAVLELAVEVI